MVGSLSSAGLAQTAAPPSAEADAGRSGADSSLPSLEQLARRLQRLEEQNATLAKQNAQLNQATIKFTQNDIFAWLRDLIPTPQRFDVVVLDPAKMTRDREGIELALKKYGDMNRLAMQAVAPGGILLTCSCTGLINEDSFLDAVRKAAYQAGRQAQIIKISGAGGDHPFLAHVQEGRYLKAIFCRLD